MAQNYNWKMETPLDTYDVIEGLTSKLYNVMFENEAGDPVYPVEVERVDVDKLIVEMSDGTKFILTCEKGG